MGLDISAYRNLKFINEAPDNEDEEDYISGYINPAWPSYAEGLLNVGGVVYAEKPSSEDRMRFRAGSYGGYNAWRTWLCRQFIGVEPQDVWEHPEMYADKPFVELINFSDCEGVIGPKLAAKLYLDFANNIDKLVPVKSPYPDFYMENYTNFMKAFKLASEGGMVVFH